MSCCQDVIHLVCIKLQFKEPPTVAGMPFINKHPTGDCTLSLLDLPIIVSSGKMWFGQMEGL